MYTSELEALPGVLRSGDPAAIEAGVVFVEADPRCFRSGYLKERLLRGLRHAPLTAGQAERLTRALLHAVDDSDRREFAQWCRLAAVRLDRRVVDAELQRRVEQHADPEVRRRAAWMLRRLAGG